MKLSHFKSLLQTHRDKQFRLLLPEQALVPVSFHITEVGHVTKNFMDCGGRVHFTQTCQLQAWVGSDTDHRIAAGKMADVLSHAASILPHDMDLDVEIEYENTALTQYRVDSHDVTQDTVLLHLSSKHTDCLAKSVCLPTSLSIAQSGCGCGPGCC